MSKRYEEIGWENSPSTRTPLSAKNLGKMDTALSEIDTAVETLESDYTVLNAKVDQFASLPSGSTSGNAELLNIRIKADGTVSETAGNAVREQVGDITERIDKIADMTPEIIREDIGGWQIGSYYTSTTTVRNYRAFSECIDHDVEYYFDDTKYRVISCYTNDPDAVIADTFDSWQTVSPVKTKKKAYKYVRIQIEDLKRTPVDVNNVGIYTVTVKYPKLVEAVANSTRMLGAKYVSTKGDDTAEGTLEKPMRTVNAALKSGASVIALMGGTYEEIIDLDNTEVSNIELRAAEVGKRVIFTDPKRIKITSESRVTGYENVYTATLSTVISANNKWIYQDGYADDTTYISDDDRHPLQRGYITRCEDTVIKLCSSTSLTDALSEIESSGTFKFFVDGTTLYFSRPMPVNASNPICASTSNGLFLNASRRNSLRAFGIETKYMSFNVSGMSSVYVSDCKAANVFGNAAMRYDDVQSATFIRCEATRCCAGTSGDGFNAHSTLTGDKTAKVTQVTLIDCWSHDNNDDGYSDHEKSESTIIGGLFEYNGKAGVTPSFGCHNTCYNVYSRHNYAGFYCCGNPQAEEGGQHTQMICYNCVAEENNRGGTLAGFRCGADGDSGNSMTLINCKSINNADSYYVRSGCTATLIDCGAVPIAGGTVKAGAGTYIIKHTTDTEGESGGGGGGEINPDYHVYSTDERVVGKWIDGKEVYERTLIAENVSLGTSSIYPFGTATSDIDSLVSLDMLLYHTDGSVYPVPRYDNTYSIGWVFTGDKRIAVRAYSTSSWLNDKIQVIIRYTKTTG